MTAILRVAAGRNLFPVLTLLFLLALASCATLPYQNPSFPGDPPVMGHDEVSLDQFLAFAQPKNPAYGRQGWTAFWQAYREACRTEGVSQAVALVQMVHETNWLKFGGAVQARQNNFAGLGVTRGGVAGLSFPDVKTGALAHVQHLKAYASTEPLRATMVDPRFRYVKRGTAPTLRSLTGRWAADPQYGDKLVKLYRVMWNWG